MDVRTSGQSVHFSVPATAITSIGKLAGLMEGVEVELRAHNGRAVLTDHEDAPVHKREPSVLVAHRDLVNSLHEWARVASAVRRTRWRESSSADEAAVVVSARGKHLAARLARLLDRPVRYVDPITERVIELPVPRSRMDTPVERAHIAVLRLFGVAKSSTEPTPWLMGLLVASIMGLVALIAMLVLAQTLVREAGGLLAAVAVLVVSAGLAPSLWLARRVPILRWVALGIATGVLLSWVGTIALAA